MAEHKEQASSSESSAASPTILMDDTSPGEAPLLWSLSLHPKTWAVLAWTAALWWLGTFAITWWTNSAFSTAEHPWAGKLQTFFLGGLALLFLAHSIQRFFRMMGAGNLPLPSSPYQRKCKESEEDFPSFSKLKAAIQANFTEPKARGEEVLWAEKGTNSGWGQVFLALGGFFVVAGVLLQPALSKDLALRAPLFGAPWILIGLVLQWGEPHRIIAMWRQGSYVRLWAFSDRGWGQLSQELEAIERSFHSVPTQEDTSESTEEGSQESSESEEAEDATSSASSGSSDTPDAEETSKSEAETSSEKESPDESPASSESSEEKKTDTSAESTSNNKDA
ncbi:MAG: hypothetical protein EP343_13810 [Deltaproteobacteria bacterium]|nr:MAG: hypothetical protein EP343_13810 [Deltaproteobacteria bacterium]